MEVEEEKEGEALAPQRSFTLEDHLDKALSRNRKKPAEIST